MLIPVKCFTCGLVIGNKYRYYLRRVKQRKLEAGQDPDKIVYMTMGNMQKTIEGEVLDQIGINFCCRRHFLSHVDVL